MNARFLRCCLALLAALAAGCVTPGSEQDVKARLERAAVPLAAGRATRVYPIWADSRIAAFGLLTEAKHDPSSPLSLQLSRSIALAARRGMNVVVGGPYPELSDRVLQNAFQLNREVPLRGLRLVLVSPSPPTPELASAANRARANLYHRPF
jgi:hypothetical protein